MASIPPAYARARTVTIEGVGAAGRLSQVDRGIDWDATEGDYWITTVIKNGHDTRRFPLGVCGGELL